MGDWGGLVPDILFMIVNRIHDARDFVSFRSVCATWRSVGKRKGSAQSLQPLRWLMFRSNFNLLSFYSFTRDKICTFILPPDTGGKHFTYTNGWILLKSRVLEEMSLVHPLSHHVISLPPFKSRLKFYPHCFPYPEKGVLSSNPIFSPHDFILMVNFHYSNKLGFWKFGDREWTVLGTGDGFFDDIIYCGGQFYAVDDKGVIYVCDIKCKSPRAICTSSFPLQPQSCYRDFYLATENTLSMLLIVRDYRNSDSTRCFSVYEVDLSGKEGCKKVDDLGTRTIFLSCNNDNESVCFENSNFPTGIIEADDICLESYRKAMHGSIGYESPPNGVMLMHIHNLKEECILQNFSYLVESLIFFPPL